jgi:hypothetical protein
MMKTKTIRVRAIRVKLPAPMAGSGTTAAAVAQSVTARVEQRSGSGLPSAATRQLQARIARALTNGGSR